ncbi:MAG: CRISPR-associated endonuclease Cas2 [Candidatus Sericytochromatia bacterium]|nr:CRISPR-associated endonuclease Cas2 [Candidatus Sericytochromatia bacterium]
MSGREARSPERRWFAVAFDVADDRRRRRLVKRLSAWGRRAQFSVFECQVALPDLARFEAELREELEADEDRLAFYELCASCRRRVRRHGQPYGFVAPMDGADGSCIVV